MKNKKYKWFTLVELIIVITILAILATIAFISFQWYSKNARDWNRLSTMKNIETWLRLYYTKNTIYPDVEFWTIIQSWATQLWTQWYLWENASRLIWFSKIPVDPDDWSKYIYSVNKLKNKFQVLWYLEKSDYAMNLNNTYASNYSSRIPKTFWDDLWIILDNNNNTISWNSVDITNQTWNFKVIFNGNEELVWTWVILKWLKSTYESWKLSWWFYDPNCDLPDVVVWDQVWAWCNSTLWYWAEWWQLDSDIWTNNYNWVIQSSAVPYWCYDYKWANLNTVSYCQKWTWSMMSNAKEINWSWANWTSWVVNNIWWKFYSWSSLETNCKWWDFLWTSNNSKCACPSWWHVPSELEWEKLETSLNWWVTCQDLGGWFFCPWLWWKNHQNKSVENNLIKALNVPISWSRNTVWVFAARWSAAWYWISKIDSNQAYFRDISSDYDTIIHWKIDKSFALSIRCVKD